MIILLIAGLIKKTLHKMSQYFSKPYEAFGGDINVTVDLSNYATKDDIKNITHVDTSSFALKSNLANLKSEVDKLDVDKLKPIPTGLNKLSDVVKNDVVKKTDHNKLGAKVDNIDTSGLVKKTDCNTKITEIEDKTLDTSSLATKTALSAVENKIPSISNLVKKTKITEIEKKLTDHKHDEYIDSSEFNTLATNVFNTRIAQANLIIKTDFDAKLSSLTRKITKNKSDHLLVRNKLNKLKSFDSSYFIGKNHLEEDGAPNYLLFQPMYRYFTIITDTDYISSWKSKDSSDKSFKPPTTSITVLHHH